MKDLANKVAFVTGGASGIGFGIATALAQSGAQVMLADIEKDALDKAVEKLRRTNAAVDGVLVDVSLRTALDDAAAKTVDRFGKVHIVVSNAGIGGELPMERWTNAGWDWIIGVNLWGVIHGFQTFAPLMRKHGEGGHFVSTASMAGIVATGAAQYGLTKHAVVAFSEAMRMDLAQHDIGVSVLCPGFIRTNIMSFHRNVPERFDGARREPLQPASSDPGAMQRYEMMKKRISEGIDPVYVGELVCEGITGNELYIFTDNEFEPMFDARAAEIKKAFDRIRHRKPRH